MRARAAHLARLIRAFHDFKALKTLRKNGPAGYGAAPGVSIRAPIHCWQGSTAIIVALRPLDRMNASPRMILVMLWHAAL
jgi:hypothetical protein